MKAYIEKIGTQLVMTIEAETACEEISLERMDGPKGSLAGEVKLKTRYQRPLLELRKEIL